MMFNVAQHSKRLIFTCKWQLCRCKVGRSGVSNPYFYFVVPSKIHSIPASIQPCFNSCKRIAFAVTNPSGYQCREVFFNRKQMSKQRVKPDSMSLLAQFSGASPWAFGVISGETWNDRPVSYNFSKSETLED